MPRMTGRKALAEMLVAEGVECIFGNPGTSETPFMDALQDYPQIKYYLALQEATVVGMAEGYARATGKPAFANVHIVGGLANSMGSLYNSYRGGTPMVLTAGNTDTRIYHTDPILTGDLVEMTRQYTKWSAQVTHASEVPMVVRRAFKEAKTPPTGPVFISLPWDSQDEEADVDIVPSSPGYHRFHPDADAVTQAAELLAQAENPIMVVGDRVAQSGGASEAVDVAELLGAKVYSAAYTEVNFPTSHPQYLGLLNVNRPATRERFAEADVLLAVGVGVFSSFLYSPEPFVSGHTRLIHLDNSSRELEKVYPTEIGMLADPKTGLQDLADALQQEMSGSAMEAAKTRAASIADEKGQARAAVQGRVKERWDRKPMSVERMMTELAQALPSNAIVTEEALTSRQAIYDAMDFDEPGSYQGLRGGALGWGMPGAIGVQMASPGRPVVGVVGDGASMYTVQALWTAARYNVPVTWVICNNRSYKILKVNMEVYLRNMLKDTQRKSEYLGTDFSPPLDLAAIAEGFGVHGRRVEEPSDLRPALEEAIGMNAPALVDVVIDGSL